PTSPETIDILASSHQAARHLATTLASLPAVSQALTIDSFVPDDQKAKLALIRDADSLLDPTLNPFLPKPEPTDGETVARLANAAAALRSVAVGKAGKVAGQAQNLSRLLDRFARGPAALRRRAQTALVPGLQTMLGQLRAALTPRPVTLSDL